MAKSNRDRIGTALDLFLEGMLPFVQRELEARHKEQWEDKVREYMRENKATASKANSANIPWDVALIINVMNREWQYLFRMKLGKSERAMLHELSEIRNDWAHQQAFSTDDAWRALDTIERLLSAISAGDQLAAVTKLKFEVQQTRQRELARQETKKVQKIGLEGQPSGGLKPWREVVTPHPDVASGRFVQAEFAADLAQVRRGDATEEYANPVEFFRRTYLTDGLSELLQLAINRLSGKGGDPVIELQTNFGGGKTHSMLALYHLFSGVDPSDLPGVDNLMKEMEVEKLPHAKRAVIVGTALSPGESHEKEDGTVVHTLWGEIAWQLLGKQGYDIVADSDKNGTSPGSDLLAELFQTVGPTLILIDEWVAYIRQMFNTHSLAGGTFDANLTFAQALTEAAKTPNVLVVASLPQSQIEVGGEGGQKALDLLTNTFTRVKRSWRPASQEESYEIVRRRLFEQIPADNVASRDVVVNAFSNLYRSQSAEFPTGCKESDYRRNLELAYPIHPELFERLYQDWASLDEFQRTRGVLRLMSSVIYSLWEGNDKSLMIMPAMIPMNDSHVIGELTTKSGLSPAWTTVIETDVDGNNSLSRLIDRENPNLGRLSACRRVARTIYMGSAPTSETSKKGIDDRKIKLGCVQPGESVSTFGDAMRRLTDQATHLYVDGSQYWYSTQPSITKLAQDRAAQHQSEDVFEVIRQRLLNEQKYKGEFERVHPCPDSSADIPDEMSTRLVILKPDSTHSGKKDLSSAIEMARSFLEYRGNSPRINRNTLIFAAADNSRLLDLVEAVRNYLAWKSIYEERDTLNLDSYQANLAKSKYEESNSTINARILETYQWLLFPIQEDPTGEIEWQAMRVSGDDHLAVRAAKKLIHEEIMLNIYAGGNLKMILDKIPLWRGNHVGVKQLSEDLAQYTYLPRMINTDVLLHSIKNGAGSLSWDIESFAYADRFDAENQRYIGLAAGGKQVNVAYTSDCILVKAEIAQEQFDSERKLRTQEEASPTNNTLSTGGIEENSIEEEKPKEMLRRFYGSINLDANRLGRDAGRVAEEILSHLVSLPNAKAEVTLEIRIEVKDGVDDQIVRTVTENCNTLKFDSYGFESE